MLRLLTVGLLFSTTAMMAAEPETFKLKAPAGWSGETIQLPPGFAPEMRFKGAEHIRFAPGMMDPESDSFFCYAFAFELEPQPALTEAVVKKEFLEYYRGLCVAVLRGKPPGIDPAAFSLDLKRVERDANAAQGESAKGMTHYLAILDWVEPFATKKPQKLTLEIQTWTKDGRNYVFACVSPQPRNAPIWKQLHGIRDNYLKK
jgi:hypothetical protein